MLFLLFQGYVVLPLLPISFPVIWICLYLYGAARIELLFTALKENEEVSNYRLLSFYLCFIVLECLVSSLSMKYSSFLYSPQVQDMDLVITCLLCFVAKLKEI